MKTTTILIFMPSAEQLTQSTLRLMHYEKFNALKAALGVVANSELQKAWRMNVYWPMFN